MAKKANKQSNKKVYEERTEELAAPIADKNGVWIYDVDYTKEGPDDFYLTVYIEKDGGVTIDDCEAVNRELSDALDEADFIRDPYTLCVSSPGLGRKLTKDRHLKNSIGQKVEVGLYRALEGTKDKALAGILEDFDSDTVTILCDPPEISNTRRKKMTSEELGKAQEPVRRVVSRKDIAVIRLYLDL